MRHINKSFKDEIQLNYKYCDIRDTKYVVLHIVDVGTAYYEATIVKDRRIATATAEIERIWLKKYSAPK